MQHYDLAMVVLPVAIVKFKLDLYSPCMQIPHRSTSSASRITT